MKFAGNVFGDKYNLRGPSDELVFLRAGLGNDQRKDRAAIRRSHGNPPVARLKPRIESQMKSKLIQIEPQAAVLIAHEDIHAVKAEVQILARC